MNYKKVLASFLFIFFLSVLQGFNTWDESWFLQVVSRVNNGETLYRDLFFGVTPLSVYVACLATSAFGVQLLVTKALVALCVACCLWLCDRIARALHIGPDLSIYFTLALFGFTPISMVLSNSLYNPLANLFFLAALLVILKNIDKCSAMLAGVLAGLCFSSKQTTGLYLLACLLGSLPRKKWLQHALVLVLSFLTVACLVLAPVYFSGGFEKFLDYGWINKKVFLRYGSFSYFDKMNFRTLHGISFVLPLLAYAGLVTVWRKYRNPQAFILLLFLTGSLVGVYPRADAYHLAFTVPCSLLSLVYCWYHLSPLVSQGLSRILKIGCKASILFCFPGFATYQLVATTHHWQRPIFTQLPHFRGILINPSLDRHLQNQIEWIHQNRSLEKDVFFLSPIAGFYYLASGISNQTPFDYPLVTTFGKSGIADLMDTFSKRPVDVYVESCRGSPLWPNVLEDYVTAHFTKKNPPHFSTALILYDSHAK